jgi:hypothetical protein
VVDGVESESEAARLCWVAVLRADPKVEEPLEVLLFEHGIVVAEKSRPLQPTDLCAQPTERVSAVRALVQHERHPSGLRVVGILQQLGQQLGVGVVAQIPLDLVGDRRLLAHELALGRHCGERPAWRALRIWTRS